MQGLWEAGSYFRSALTLSVSPCALMTGERYGVLCRISDYVNYIEGLEAVEEDDTVCVDNRLLLEKAWQIIANEFYDAKGHFSQASWAEQLLGTLKVMPGPLAHCQIKN